MTLRILMATNRFHPLAGGSEHVVFETSRRLVRRGHEVHVLTERTRPQWPYYERVEGIHVHRCRVRFGNPALRFLTGVMNAGRLFKRLAAARPFDIVHFHLTLPSLGILLCRESRQPVKLASFYGPWDAEERLERNVEGRLNAASIKAALFGKLQGAVLRRSRRIVVLSRFSHRQVIDMLGTPPPVRVIPGGVDTDRFHPAADRRAVKAALHLPFEEPVLLTVRRHVPRMGLDALIGAMPAILNHGRRVMLVVGGDGPLRPSLERQAAALGLQDRIRFTGFIAAEALPSYYQAADLFLLPTRALEGFGLSTVEALACGTPVLGTSIGATAEILQDLDPRLLIPEGTPEGIAETTRACLDSPVMDGAFRLRCRRYAEDRYAWPRALDRLEAVYRDLMALKIQERL